MRLKSYSILASNTADLLSLWPTKWMGWWFVCSLFCRLAPIGFCQTATVQSLSGDGIPDHWREQYFDPNSDRDSRAAAVADPDGDGANNYQEFLAGTDPLDSNSVHRVPLAIRTYAGSVQGQQNGPLVSATFSYPVGFAQDAQGRLYVTEAYTPRLDEAAYGGQDIRMIDTNGIVSTWTGSAEPGLVEGPRLEARYRVPNYLVFDSFGNAFLTDRYNHRIRKVDTNGMVSTFAGSTRGFRDGAGTNAQFRAPFGITIDAQNNLYVADWENARVRKITPDGTVSTFAGSVEGYRDGPRSEALFAGPDSVAMTKDGILYVADWLNGKIRKISPDGFVSTLASGLPFIDALNVDGQGNVYATVTTWNALIKFAPNGEEIWRLAPPNGTEDGPLSVAKITHFNAPYILPNGDILVAEDGAHRLRLIKVGPPPLLQISPEPGRYADPMAVTLSTPVTNGVIRYTLDGSIPVPASPPYTATLRLAGSVALSARVFVNGYPVSDVLTGEFVTTGIDDGIPAAWREQYFGIGYATSAAAAAVADPDADGANNYQEFLSRTDPLDRFSVTRIPFWVSTWAGSNYGTNDGFRTEAKFNFSTPDMTFDALGRIWMPEGSAVGFDDPGPGYQRLRVIDENGFVSTFAGAEVGLVDGPASVARFGGPRAFVLDSRGMGYLLDRYNNRIRKIDPSGRVSTFAGSTRGSRDGPALEAQFNVPMGLCVDAADNFYVADFFNLRIRKVTPEGQVSTFAGGTRGRQDGPRASATFDSPADIACAKDGTLYVADWSNGMIRKIATNGIVSTFVSDLRFVDRVSLDSSGNVYASGGAGGIRKYDRNGKIVWSMTNPAGYRDGPAAQAQFVYAQRILERPDGHLLVSDPYNIRLVTMRAAPVLIDLEAAASDGGSGVTVKLSTIVTNATIHYTLDESEPTAASPRYTGAISAATPVTVRARAFVNGLPISEILTSTLPQPPGPAVIANWKFDEQDGISARDSIGTFHGTLSRTGASFVPGGISGNALRLNRERGGFVNMGDVLGLTSGSFSLAAWIRMSAGDTTTNSQVLSKHAAGYNNGYFLNVNRSGILGQESKAMLFAGEAFRSLTSTTSVNDGNWHQLVGVYEAGGNSLLYVDGTPVEAGIPSKPVLNSPAPFLIGGATYNATPVGLFSGWIDEVQVYAGALSSLEVDYLFQNPGRSASRPWILTHPADRVVALRSRVTFSVVATGSEPLAYQWQFNGANIPGATDSAYAIDAVRSNQAGVYQVVVRNPLGATTSTPARLSIAAPGPSLVQVVTLAGTNLAGYQDGEGRGVKFNSPNGGHVGPERFAFVADTFNHRIRRVDLKSGQVTTLAGDGQAGYLDGTAAEARFNMPLGVFAGASGELWVADAGNNRIRKISFGAPPMVTTIAGSGTAGYMEGVGTNAQFSFPNDLVADRSGNLYVSEFNNHTIRIISPAGEVTTFVGDGTARYNDGKGKEAQLNQPAGLAIDRTGTIYLTEWGSHRIRKITPGGSVTTLAGSVFPGILDGTGPEARFNQPDGIAVDPVGNLYVTEHGNHTIRKISPQGRVTIVAGTGLPGYVDGDQSVAQFNAPGGIGLDFGGNLLVADTENHSVRIVKLLLIPQITAPPRSQTVPYGTNVVLQVAAIGPEPLAYQWLLNGEPIPSATASSFVLNNARPADAGNYSVIVSNSHGAATSESAELRVLPRADFVRRDLPPVYSPRLKFRVVLRASPPSDAAVYAVEDGPPAGWSISDISDSGFYDATRAKVKFGPFFDRLPRNLSYVLTPPPGDLDRKTFSGLVSVDGDRGAIGGEAQIALAPMHPCDRNPADFRIAIDELTAYGTAWRKGTRWPVEPNPIPIDFVTRAGALWRAGEDYVFNTAAATAPIWWESLASGNSLRPQQQKSTRATDARMAAERILPSRFLPSEFSTVEIAVKPAGAVTAYAAQDRIPRDWTVENINQGGEFDLATRLVKWGPYLDDTPRLLRYQVRPGPARIEPSEFIGTVSFDGVSIPISGQRLAQFGIGLTALMPRSANQFQLRLHGWPGEKYRIETSTDLRDWTPLGIFTNENETVFIDYPHPSEPHRFFRAVAE
ncbi:MAG: chitobiase/beta-hexosaminidase C-terminal domain-containing protein [Verrucomicrobia bacterium]|nr:chitobiase/beta-hexosaminidase C-terminal domain-containing protein [Verrucomicrobiota bacterium]